MVLLGDKLKKTQKQPEADTGKSRGNDGTCHKRNFKLRILRAPAVL